MKISIVVPVYGSAKILKEGHEAFTRAVGKVTGDYEILFRVDGSPDNSEEVAAEIASRDEHVRVFTHRPNRGLGYTLRNLFADARGEYVIYFDADAFISFDMSFLKVVVEKIEESGVDAVIASRYFSNPMLPFRRWLASEAYYYLNRLLFGIQIRDIGSGFVIFRKASLDSMDLKSDGFEIHTEIFVRMARKGFRIIELPLPYKHWEGGSFNLIKHGPKALISTMCLWREIR